MKSRKTRILVALGLVAIGSFSLMVVSATVSEKTIKSDLTNAIQRIPKVKITSTDYAKEAELTNLHKLFRINTNSNGFVLGDGNSQAGDNSTVLGGKGSITSSNYNTIIGGDNDVIYGSNGATILGGKGNKIRNSSSDSAIAGGNGNTVDYMSNGVVIGSNNSTNGGAGAINGVVVGNNSTADKTNSVALGENSNNKATSSFLWTDSTHNGTLTDVNNNTFVVVAGSGMVVNTGKAHNFAQLTIGGSLTIDQGQSPVCGGGKGKGVLRVVNNTSNTSLSCFCSCDGTNWSSLFGAGMCSSSCNSNVKPVCDNRKVDKICTSTGYVYSGYCEVGDVVEGVGAYVVEDNQFVHWSCQTNNGEVRMNCGTTNIEEHGECVHNPIYNCIGTYDHARFLTGRAVNLTYTDRLTSQVFNSEADVPANVKCAWVCDPGWYVKGRGCAEYRPCNANSSFMRLDPHFFGGFVGFDVPGLGHGETATVHMEQVVDGGVRKCEGRVSCNDSTLSLEWDNGCPLTEDCTEQYIGNYFVPGFRIGQYITRYAYDTGYVYSDGTHGKIDNDNKEGYYDCRHDAFCNDGNPTLTGAESCTYGCYEKTKEGYNVPALGNGVTYKADGIAEDITSGGMVIGSRVCKGKFKCNNGVLSFEGTTDCEIYYNGCASNNNINGEGYKTTNYIAHGATDYAHKEIPGVGGCDRLVSCSYGTLSLIGSSMCNLMCSGTEPEGSTVYYKGVANFTDESYTPTSWTRVSDTTSPGACQWRCNTANGYVWNGSSCVLSTSTCGGTKPSGTKYKLGSTTYTYGYTPTSWTRVSDSTSTLGSCQWRCNTEQGYNWNGSDCVLATYTCGGTKPSGTKYKLGSTTYTYGHTPDTWDRVDDSTSTLGSCEWRCNTEQGYAWNGSDCVLSTSTCGGTKPSGNKYKLGSTIYTYGYTPTSWTRVSDATTPLSCQWRCNVEEGYQRNGSDCVLGTYTCGGTKPTGEKYEVGPSTYVYGHTPDTWTRVNDETTPGACQWRCNLSLGYEWDGSDCIKPKDWGCSVTQANKCIADDGSVIDGTSSNYANNESTWYCDGILCAMCDDGTIPENPGNGECEVMNPGDEYTLTFYGENKCSGSCGIYLYLTLTNSAGEIVALPDDLSIVGRWSGGGYSDNPTSPQTLPAGDVFDSEVVDNLPTPNDSEARWVGVEFEGGDDEIWVGMNHYVIDFQGMWTSACGGTKPEGNKWELGAIMYTQGYSPTTWQWVGDNTVPGACQYRCNVDAGYRWNGTDCVLTCGGTKPDPESGKYKLGATVYQEGHNPDSWTRVGDNTNPGACQWRCNKEAGYTWDASRGDCVNTITINISCYNQIEEPHPGSVNGCDGPAWISSTYVADRSLPVGLQITENVVYHQVVQPPSCNYLNNYSKTATFNISAGGSTVTDDTTHLDVTAWHAEYGYQSYYDFTDYSIGIPSMGISDIGWSRMITVGGQEYNIVKKACTSVSTPLYTCEGIMPSGNKWQLGAVTYPEGYTPYEWTQVSDVTVPQACQYRCNVEDGYRWNGSDCVLPCGGTPPSGNKWKLGSATYSEGYNPYNWTRVSDATDPGACQYRCNVEAGYRWNGSDCVLLCEGDKPEGDKYEVGSTTYTSPTYSPSSWNRVSDATAPGSCQWRCNVAAGYVWNESEGDCVLPCGGDKPLGTTQWQFGVSWYESTSYTPKTWARVSDSTIPGACQYRCNVAAGYSWDASRGACVLPCGGGPAPSGDKYEVGSSTYTEGYTPNTWTRVDDSTTPGACQWRCNLSLGYEWDGSDCIKPKDWGCSVTQANKCKADDGSVIDGTGPMTHVNGEYNWYCNNGGKFCGLCDDGTIPENPGNGECTKYYYLSFTLNKVGSWGNYATQIIMHVKDENNVATSIPDSELNVDIDTYANGNTYSDNKINVGEQSDGDPVGGIVGGRMDGISSAIFSDDQDSDTIVNDNKIQAIIGNHVYRIVGSYAMLTCEGYKPSGEKYKLGSTTYAQGYTPTSWSRVDDDTTPGACQWRCNTEDGFYWDGGNDCVSSNVRNYRITYDPKDYYQYNEEVEITFQVYDKDNERFDEFETMVDFMIHDLEEYFEFPNDGECEYDDNGIYNCEIEVNSPGYSSTITVTFADEDEYTNIGNNTITFVENGIQYNVELVRGSIQLPSPRLINISCSTNYDYPDSNSLGCYEGSWTSTRFTASEELPITVLIGQNIYLHGRSAGYTDGCHYHRADTVVAKYAINAGNKYSELVNFPASSVGWDPTYGFDAMYKHGASSFVNDASSQMGEIRSLVTDKTVTIDGQEYIIRLSNDCVEPKCGSAHGQTLSSQPDSDERCYIGSPSSVTPYTNYYSWTCSLLGEYDNCSAQRVSANEQVITLVNNSNRVVKVFNSSENPFYFDDTSYGEDCDGNNREGECNLRIPQNSEVAIKYKSCSTGRPIYAQACRGIDANNCGTQYQFNVSCSTTQVDLYDGYANPH